jgi:hypothetical protein
MQVTGHKTTAMLQRYNITVEQDTYYTLTRPQEFLQRAQSSHREQNLRRNEGLEGTLTS